MNFFTVKSNWSQFSHLCLNSTRRQISVLTLKNLRKIKDLCAVTATCGFFKDFNNGIRSFTFFKSCSLFELANLDD